MNKTKRVMLKITASAAIIAGLIYWANPVSAGQNIDVSATLNPSASIELSSAGSFTISPTGNGTFNHSDFNIKAYTNSLAGYTIVMTTSDTNLNLTNSSESEVDELTAIPTLEANESGYHCLTFAEEAALLSEDPDALIPECTFASNRWGIAVNSGNYYPVFSGMIINRTHAATGSTGDITTVKLGAKVDILAASGTYEATLNFAIVANVSEYIAKVNFADENISSVTFTAGSEEQTVSASGDSVDLDINTEYTVTATFADGYELDAWTATGGMLASSSANPAVFSISENNYGDLTVSSKATTLANN